MKLTFPTIIPPLGGWEANTYYLVEVSFNRFNPAFGAIFFTGFLNGKDQTPGGYNFIISGSGDTEDIDKVVFMRSIRKLTDNTELNRIPNHWKNPSSDDFDLTPLKFDTPPLDEKK